MARKFSISAHQPAELVTSQAPLGRMVRAARTTQELRIDDAAGLLNVSVALLSALESGSDRSISLNKILDVLDGIGLSLIVTTKGQARQAVKDILDGVSGAEERHLRDELASLLGKLLAWKFRARHRTPELEAGIEAQQKEVIYEITRRPEIAGKLSDPAWMQVIWSRAVVMAAGETGLHDFPEGLPWRIEDVLRSGWLPIDWDPRESERDI